ncbi:MAG: hypothetical protein JWN34_2226, partial [Bryobacterales bacterium]|nr:hypothetical protein [Bryobacterales bacterium]
MRAPRQFSRGLKPTSAGPFMTSPFAVKREPWQGQSHDFSVGFQWTI